ncbi:hypothetical protein BH10ACI2_BH10ACI2_08860 [soil metagenome]
MSTTTEELISSERITEMALALPSHQQALLLARLHENLESLDRDSEHDAVWAAEIERRVREVESGEAELIDHEVVMREVREMLAR